MAYDLEQIFVAALIGKKRMLWIKFTIIHRNSRIYKQDIFGKSAANYTTSGVIGQSVKIRNNEMIVVNYLGNIYMGEIYDNVENVFFWRVSLFRTSSD